LGSFGDAGVFGFYPNKQITTGEGGALLTSNPELAALARTLRNQGRSTSSDWLQHAEVGYNFRISEMNCALGLAQLQRIDEILLAREYVAREYGQCLKGSPFLDLPKLELPRGKISWFVYVVRLAEKFTGADRDSILQKMRDRGIECGRYFAPIHLQPAYASEPHRRMNLKTTESIAPRTLALPFFTRLTPAEVQTVSGTLLELLENCR
jgi:perosamine synthetase